MNFAILEGAQQGSPMMMLVTFGAIFAVMYIFMLRPQQKKRKALEEQRKNVKKGDKVITIGGIHGKVISVDENTVTISVEEGKLKLDKSAITIDGSETIPAEANQ